MKKILGQMGATLVVIGSMLGACSTLYTEADIEEAERREDAETRAEVVNDMEIGEEGGTVNSYKMDFTFLMYAEYAKSSF